jgi:hypothetical protein
MNSMNRKRLRNSFGSLHRKLGTTRPIADRPAGRHFVPKMAIRAVSVFLFPSRSSAFLALHRLSQSMY